MTLAEAAVCLRAENTPANRALVFKLIADGHL
jgi:hypothetical protein